MRTDANKITEAHGNTRMGTLEHKVFLNPFKTDKTTPNENLRLCLRKPQVKYHWRFPAV